MRRFLLLSLMLLWLTGCAAPLVLGATGLGASTGCLLGHTVGSTPAKPKATESTPPHQAAQGN